MSEGSQLSFDAIEDRAPAPPADAPAQPADAPLPAGSPAPPPTSEQERAISARDRDIFMEAGAGTGKTRVLVDRYCEAVDRDGVEPERILAFTFTEKAAAEMRRRVRFELAGRARRAGGERRRRLLRLARTGESAPITTIHGFCRRLLGAHPVAAGLDPRFRVLDADESARLAAIAFDRALTELATGSAEIAQLAAGYRHRLRGIVGAVYADLRNHGQATPELPPLQINAFDGREEAADPLEVEIASAGYEALRELLRSFGERFGEIKAERSGVDFDDLQIETLELLRRVPAIATAQRERFDHLLVDEFQDTSPIQIELIDALRGPQTRLFTVGDEFQSIYAFRGADLASFRRRREAARESSNGGAIVRLSGSFRSSPDVVATVNAVGRALLEGFAPLRVGRSDILDPRGAGDPTVELLLTERAGWEPESIRTAATETPANRIAEARFLARRLRELADDGVAPGSMVVLLRAFTHVDAYAEALELAGLDPYVVGGRGYWSAQQVEDALRLLECVANPLADEALFGALASPAAGVGPDALWMLRRIAGRRRHVWPAIERYLLEPGHPSRQEGEDGADGGTNGGGTTAADGAAGAEATDPEEAARAEAEAEAEAEARLWVDRLPAGDRERIELFARRLRELRRGASQLALDALVEDALATFGYDLVALTLPGGRRRGANLRKLVRIAAEYELHEGRDLRGFLAYAAERAALSDRESEATTAAEGHDGVRVMTIHAAKGLEFDCVAVADLGRGMAGGGRPPELRLAFGTDGEAAEEGSPAAAPRVGLRLARAGAGSLDVEGYRALNDDAAAADAEESARLVYVAASRARERLLLSGLFDPEDVDGGRSELKPSHSALARLLPALGASGSAGELLTVPAAEPREEIDAGFEPARIVTRVNEASAESAEELSAISAPPVPAGPPGERVSPPMLALAERPGSAARSLSYAALADYGRCGYRFLIERVVGVGEQAPAPAAGAEEEIPAAGREDDEEPEGPRTTGGRANAAGGGGRLAFGRSVHALLEASARNSWAPPDRERVAAALQREGADPAAGKAAAGMVEGWLSSPLLAELTAAGASFRPEVPFRIALGSDTVIRGTIDLLVDAPDRPPMVVDYKTGAAPGAEDELPDSYSIQRALYALAIAEATGAERVATAYLFLADPQRPVRAELDPAAIAAGRARIEALVERIRGRDFTVTDAPHAALCHDCPARARLCPHPPERTMASQPG